MKFDVDWFYWILSTYASFIENHTQLTDTVFIINVAQHLYLLLIIPNFIPATNILAGKYGNTIMEKYETHAKCYSCEWTTVTGKKGRGC
jgi:hypothetical protein